MDDPEPYVADPREPRPPPRLAHRTLRIGAAAVLVIALAVAWVLFVTWAEEDPALDVPFMGPTEEPTAPPGS